MSGSAFSDLKEGDPGQKERDAKEPCRDIFGSTRAGPATEQPGDSGPVVSTLQKALGVVADGDFGPFTSDALAAYQRKHALTQSGVPDAATWRALDRLAPVRVSWAAAAAARDSGSRSRQPASGSAPASARLPPVADEIRPTESRFGEP